MPGRGVNENLMKRLFAGGAQKCNGNAKHEVPAQIVLITFFIYQSFKCFACFRNKIKSTANSI